MSDQFEKFSNHYKKSLKTAARLAMELNHFYVKPEHILYGLAVERGSVGAELFTSLEIKAEDLKNNISKINQTAQPDNETNWTPKFSAKAKAIIQKSIQVSFINKHKYIGTEHLLAALLQIKDEAIDQIFKELRIPEQEITRQVVSVLKSASKLPDITETFRVAKEEAEEEINQDQGDRIFWGRPASVLELFGTNLTSPKVQKKIDPVIGREEEISRVIQILSRRNKNNPIILGDPGVGKTAIVEGLAKKIVNQEVPEILANKKIYSLDLAATIAGTMYRGEFENRLKQIIDETTKRNDVILFIDEIHNIIGAGSASGSMDAANILKPALARGDIHCIGATTFEDYRKSIENEPALDRRFQPVKVAEPTKEQAQKILFGIRDGLENFHKVKISDEAINAAIELSQRYLTNKFLPDKAIDLLDEACAAVKVNRKPTANEQKIKTLEDQIKHLQQQKQQAITIEDFTGALRFKAEEKTTQDELTKATKTKKDKEKKISGRITRLDIARIVSRSTGIPTDNLLAAQKKQILKIDQGLKNKIIGQDQALTEIANFIKRAKAGLMAETKPLASFMFVGPSGVGKTYTARILAEMVFGKNDSLIKIDMSEYSEKFNLSKLIGAPAGYVGYKESGQLTEKIKHRPYSLVLFDEIEKANPEAFDLLLQILDDGYLTDAVGTKINFRNTIIIMTSNIGSQYFQMGQSIGFGHTESNQQNWEEKIITEVKKNFKAEFINRLDKLIYFQPLGIKQLEKIVKLELRELEQKLSRQQLTLSISPSAVSWLAKQASYVNQGARGINKVIQDSLEGPLAEKILSGAICPQNNVHLSAKNGIIDIQISN
ncbi:MAG TPA: ATP-dependent Clp protease ATP-binding subunit [bacterium]|nr:ATP-dependent Clp protease ATP-binding subunit [bacterium]HPN81694.1 ATP-dependent Clp protease ATP-binding subunit [bacterium]HPW39647.1 ATP-dependent Clp protease ATP-binding subunit [bacterium]